MDASGSGFTDFVKLEAVEATFGWLFFVFSTLLRDISRVMCSFYNQENPMNTLDIDENRKLSDQDVRDILHLTRRLSGLCTPEQIALAAAIPRDLAAFAEEHDVSLPMLHSILGKLIKAQGEYRRDLENFKKRVTNRGANEMIILDAYNELAMNPEAGCTEAEVIERAITIKGEPVGQKARNNMKMNFTRAIRSLCRDEVLLSVGGKLSMFEKEM